MDNSNEFVIRRAERVGAKVFIQLAGLSSSGKTYTAIRLGRGLSGVSGKMGYVDTEQRRASLYSDVAGGFDVIDLNPPFSPQRYQQAIDTFKGKDYQCLIIDSMSHEWDGVGGVLEFADLQRTSKGYELTGQAKWMKPKKMHKDLIDHIVRSGLHVIGCYKVKEPMEEIVGDDGKKKFIKGKRVIVTEPDSNRKYDATIAIILDENNAGHVLSVDKCPSALRHLFPVGALITEETGKAIADWLEGTAPVFMTLDELIKAFDKADDQTAWFNGLKDAEKAIVKANSAKFKRRVTVESPAPQVEQSTEPSTGSLDDL